MLGRDQLIGRQRFDLFPQRLAQLRMFGRRRVFQDGYLIRLNTLRARRTIVCHFQPLNFQAGASGSAASIIRRQQPIDQKGVVQGDFLEEIIAS